MLNNRIASHNTPNMEPDSCQDYLLTRRRFISTQKSQLPLPQRGNIHPHRPTPLHQLPIMARKQHHPILPPGLK